MLKLQRRRRGQGMTEYIIIVGLIAIALITAVGVFKDALQGAFQEGAKQIDEKVTTPMQGG